MITLRYDIVAAEEAGENKHPQLVMMDIGYDIREVKAWADKMENCWYFEVEEVKEILPDYVTVIEP